MRIEIAGIVVLVSFAINKVVRLFFALKLELVGLSEIVDAPSDT